MHFGVRPTFGELLRMLVQLGIQNLLRALGVKQ